MEDAKRALWKESSFLKYNLFNSFNYFGSGMSIVALPMYVCVVAV